MEKKIPIIAVVGPTATGKTALSVALAERLSAEIISCDSMQIYKGMHIASAAPDEEEKGRIPHHLFEFLDSSQTYSVAEYVKDANKVIRDIVKRGKRPVLVGGTGLYVTSLIDNIMFTEGQTDVLLRQRLEAEYDTIGAEAMIERLKSFDAESARTIHPNNKKRVVRAFEIYEQTGKTMTEQLKNSRSQESPYIPYIIGLKSFDRSVIYDRINQRVDHMLERGLLEEAKRAFQKPGSETAVQAIGHKEFFGYFKGECSLEEAVELLKRETRRYAKRQLTWFGRDERTEWIDIDKTEDIVASAVTILERKGYFE